MARNYPKYLYQNVTNAVSTGEFICSLVSPRILVKVKHKGLHVDLDLIDTFEPVSEDNLKKIIPAMLKWYIHNIHLPAKEERGVSIHEAYASLIDTPALNKLLELSKSTVSNIKKNISESNSFPKHDTMRDHLTKCGWQQLTSEKWDKL